MKLTIERDAALKALNLVQGAVAKRGTIPILANVLLEAAEGLSITATDMTLTASTKAVCAVSEPGAVTIPAQHLGDILKNLPLGADLEMSLLETGRLSVKSGRSNFKIPTLPAKDFPSLPAVSVLAELTLRASDMAALIEDSAFAGDRGDNVRPLHSSLCLHAVGGNLRSVSTRGQVLAYAETPCSTEDFPETIVPLSSMAEVQKLLATDPSSLAVLIRGEGRMSVALGATMISTLLTAGKYWDYERLIPRTFANEISVDTDLLVAAVTRSMIMERNIRFMVENGSAKMMGRSMDQGESGDEVDVEYDGDTFRTSFLGTHLLETLAHVRTENVLMKFSGKGPVILLETGEPSTFFLVMTLGS